MTLPSNCSTVELAYWNPFTGPDGPFMGKLVDKFNAANPNIKVTMTSQAEYNTKLATASASDALPDVAIINEDQIATQAFNHIIRAEDALVQQIGIGQSDFPAEAWKLGQVNGHTYGIPLSIVPMTMYYNDDLMKKANISAPPTNAADFDKAAAAMTSGANHGFVITSGFPIQQIFQQLLHQYGGSEYNADATQATWNSDAGVKALQWMVDAQKKYSAPKLPVDADLNAFKAGQAGMIWNGIWQTTNVTGDAVDFAGKATAPPQIGDQPATWGGMALLSLPAHKKAVDQCKESASGIFVKYILDNSVEWAKAGNIPASNKVRSSPEFQAVQPQASIAPGAEHPVFPPSVPGISDAFGPLGDAVGAIMAGTSTDIKGQLDKAADRANQILKQNADKYGTNPDTFTPPPPATATP
jgi:multiple sugar transport system substrate-binding protein